MRLPEEKKVVPVMASADIGAGVDASSINMSKYHRVAFVCTFGSLVDDAVLKVYSGAAAGEKTTARTFSYAVGGAVIGSEGCDVLGEESENDALTLTAANYSNRMLIIEIVGTGLLHRWLTLSLSNAATSGACNIVAILEPRYTCNKSASALS